MADYSMSDEDWGFLDDNSAVQQDNINFNPEVESSAWAGDYGNYDYSFPQTQQSNFDMNNVTNSPMDGWQQNGTDWGSVDQQLGSTFNSPQQQMYDMGSQVMQGTPNVLAQLFNSKAGVSGLGALVEGMQNRKKASATNQLAQRMQPAMDPFGSQRAQYQQQLSSAYQDPYSQPIVRDQVAQIQRAQAIKDAAAGRRSNSATSDPAMLAAQAQIAQKYIDSLQTPAGANINPSGLSSLLQMQQSGMNAGINGMASPLLSALGYNTGSNSNSQAMSNMQLTPQQQQALIKMLGTGGQ